MAWHGKNSIEDLCEKKGSSINKILISLVFLGLMLF